MIANDWQFNTSHKLLLRRECHLGKEFQKLKDLKPFINTRFLNDDCSFGEKKKIFHLASDAFNVKHSANSENSNHFKDISSDFKSARARMLLMKINSNCECLDPSTLGNN